MDFAALEKGKTMSKEYIECGALIARYDAEHVGSPGRARELMATAPAADVISKGLYEQIKWERDVALAQLEEYGVSLGEKADVAEVQQGLWIQPHWKNSNYCCNCSECGGEAMHREYQWDKNGIYPICPNCGAKMNKEK